MLGSDVEQCTGHCLTCAAAARLTAPPPSFALLPDTVQLCSSSRVLPAAANAPPHPLALPPVMTLLLIETLADLSALTAAPYSVVQAVNVLSMMVKLALLVTLATAPDVPLFLSACRPVIATRAEPATSSTDPMLLRMKLPPFMLTRAPPAAASTAALLFLGSRNTSTILGCSSVRCTSGWQKTAEQQNRLALLHAGREYCQPA